MKGGSADDRIKFYTALYHTLIHPNILNDVNGEYPKSKTRETGRTTSNRYTVFSLWDTYRNYHQLIGLLYPKQQLDMVNTMLSVYDESGWLPKWELNSTETYTMVGDPASIVIAETYLKGLKDFDVSKAYTAMLKSATQTSNNPLRPGLAEYIKNGILSTNQGGSVSTTLEYNVADHAISIMADKLGYTKDADDFKTRSLSYKKLFDNELKLLRPINPDGTFYKPFDPVAGANFTENVGFIEGNSWQYSFMVPHDIQGLIKLMGGDKSFAKQLQNVFDKEQFDMANEPDIAYPFLFNYVKGEEWRTQKLVRYLIEKYFQNKPAGLPGNDDTGTMSAWLVYAMMGFYPASIGDNIYQVSSPVFDEVEISLDENYYPSKSFKIITKNNSNENRYIRSIKLNGKQINKYSFTHDELINGAVLEIELGDKPKR